MDGRNQKVPDAETLFQRARDSASQLRNFLISFSAAAIGAFFLALTGDISPPLNTLQQWTCIIALFIFTISLFGGLLQWRADVKRNYFWAKAITAEDAQNRNLNYKIRDRWLRVRRISGATQRLSFCVAIILSAAYIVERVLGL